MVLNLRKVTFISDQAKILPPPAFKEFVASLHFYNSISSDEKKYLFQRHKLGAV